MGTAPHPLILAATLTRRSIRLRASTYGTARRCTRCTGVPTPPREVCTRAAASWSAAAPAYPPPPATPHLCTAHAHTLDTSANGHTPLHMQVNYVYELATIDANHSAYVTSGAVAASPAVRALVDLAVAVAE